MTKPIQHPLHSSGDLSSAFAWPAVFRLLGLALLAIALLGSAQSQAAPAKTLSDGAFAARVCGIYVSPVGSPRATDNMTFAGAGAGCTWKVGHGDVGTTATEIMMVATRNLNKEELDQQLGFWKELPEVMAAAPGFRVKEFQINCNTIGASGKIVFWGMPSTSNIMGYAVCGNNIVHGTIHTPPDSEMDTELVFGQLMNAVAAQLN